MFANRLIALGKAILPATLSVIGVAAADARVADEPMQLMPP